MAEILGCMKPYKYWDKLPINWCRISAINSIPYLVAIFFYLLGIAILKVRHLQLRRLIAGTWKWGGGGRRKAKWLNLEITLHKFNMEPKNDGFQKESPIPGCHFQVNQPLNFGRVSFFKLEGQTDIHCR